MSRQATTFEESCPECNASTPHTVTLEIRQEADSSDSVGHSRTPYRVTECHRCETTRVKRMNNV